VFPDPIAQVLTDQSGMIARRQALAAGAKPHDIERWRRRKDLTIVHPGVYCDHTGEPTWMQRAWAAVLACDRAALWGEAALRAHEGPGRPGSDGPLIEVAVDRPRHLDPPVGVRLQRVARLDERVLWHLAPPRQRYDDAALEVALARTDKMAAIEVLARAVQDRRTTAERLVRNVAARPRVSDRDWLGGVLRDLTNGTCSVLEHGYVTLVERPHGLPTATRQRAGMSSVGVVYRDNAYDGGLVVELDGRLFHDTARQRDADFERDLDLAMVGGDTRRLSYGQVFSRGCSTAGKVARLLELRGWTGRVQRCEPGCVAVAVFCGDGAA